MLAITNTKITKIKVAKWGTPKKYLKNKQNSFQAFAFNNGQHFYYIIQQNAPKPGKKLYFHN
jgi:hypothetical protein